MAPFRLHVSLLAAMLTVLAACAAPGAGRAPAAGDAEGLMAAAEADLAAGDLADARLWLGGLRPEALDAPQRARLRLLQAELLLAEDEPIEALQALPLAAEVRAWPELGLRLEADRAQVLFRIGDIVGATRTLVAREKTLTDPAQVHANRELLWSGLGTADLDAAPSSRTVKADATTRGWIEYATISRSVWLDARDREARLARWRADFPGHPAEAMTAVEAEAAPLRARGELRALALLLPLSGPHAAAAEAVRDGFFAAWYDARGALPATPAVRVYDTGATPDTLLAAHRAALDDGAEFIVGPLTREDVTALVDGGRLPVPVLALNYLDAGKPAPFNLYQWGLAPEDEARQAAEHAIAARQVHAVSLVPEGEWGERIARAFQERFEALGGTLLAANTYVAAERDYSTPIRALLALDASEERHRALTNALGIRTQFQPRRRDDVDLVFIAARPEQARQLGPQLRFHRTGELPVYATATIWDGDAPGPDLAGLRFCDMPWMMATDGDAAALRGRLRALFPARPKEHTRLLALGHDAYTLVQLIERGQLQQGSFFPAVSGTLSLRNDGVIARRLSCAEIRGNGLKALELPPLTSAR
jgi:outer membrane PBP1 activator LpoA protein